MPTKPDFPIDMMAELVCEKRTVLNKGAFDNEVEIDAIVDMHILHNNLKTYNL